jgi:MFS family permease
MTASVGGVTIDVSFWAFFLLMLLHSLAYVPTISITNSIAFAHLKDPQHEFGYVRVWGTIGWIVASWPLIFILADWSKIPEFASTPFVDWLGAAVGSSKAGDDYMHSARYIFLLAGGASLLLAAYSLWLPHTPPKPAGGTAEKLAWLEAVKLLQKPFVLVLFIVTFIDAAVHQSFFYWTYTFLKDNVLPKDYANWVSPVMKIGQLAEIITMVFLGYVLKRLGWRYTMILGVIGHAARFAVFAYYKQIAEYTHLPVWVSPVFINVVHGICYAFFFATVYIFIDEFFPKDIRSSAQGLFNFLILGLGPFAANFACSWLGNLNALAKDKDGVPIKFDFPPIFVASLTAALFAAVLLLAFFHPPARKEPERAETPTGAGEGWKKPAPDAQSVQPAQSDKIEAPRTDIS